MQEKVNWLTHAFNIYDPGTVTWNEVGGVYIFCHVNRQNQWAPLYIGQADNFKQRLSCHDRWEEARRLGATHVHARVVQPEETRLQVERELIQTWQPPLNSHHCE